MRSGSDYHKRRTCYQGGRWQRQHTGSLVGIRNTRRVTLSQEQLEWIVREVVRRLQTPHTNGAGTVASTRLSLAERLVTTETLRDRLDGVTEVQTIAGAIVTPAVVDLLKERQIALVRTSNGKGARQ